MKSPSQYIQLIIVFISIIFVNPTNGQAINPKFTPKKGDHIIVLGNTFADRMRHYNFFETLLRQNFPDKQLTMRNMGWSADEVGLQPRPFNFPKVEEKEQKIIDRQKEVKFQGFIHERERIVMPVALNFQGLNQDLNDQKADIIFLCFGMNEAFKGPAGLPQFEKDLNVFIQNLLNNQYNGSSRPWLLLVSPIAHEEMGVNFPNPVEYNKNLELYTNVMKKMAASKGLFFIDLFTPSFAKMKQKGNDKLTINGIHLTSTGYKLAAEWMGQSLGFEKKIDFNSDGSKKLSAVIKMKDDHFFYRWRAVNGEYIYGRRREPFGVISYPAELKKLNQMTVALDSVLWEMDKGNGDKAYKKAVEIVDRRGKPIDRELMSDIPMTGRQGEAAKAAVHAHPGKIWPATTEQFKLPAGYEINLFASEKDFPIEKPVAMNFDARGRLWVATLPTYPQYFPGIPVNDKIIILEDTNADGKADKYTVFADNLYLPLGFEFGDGGVYVSQEPDILFLKDTDGDDKADIKEVVLTGFGSEDSHHATHAFTFGQDGALYFNEGTFLNSQIETPYGPIRSYAGATYRYEPRTAKLTHYISYPYYNPWGSVFDKWGMHLIGDASDGSNYFASPMTGNVTYPEKHPRTKMFTETRVRPTAGIEIISSRQFPEAVQGDFLVNNNIGFQGTKQHQIIHQGSGIVGKEVEPMLQSSDPNYRPIDLKFGPDGGLYIVDWFNPLISHGENSLRDPERDKSHGRIWRITYPDKPLLKVTDISKHSIPQLLENLKEYEDRFRYRSRAQIREKKVEEVLPELKKWVTSLDKTDPKYEHNLLEGLWLYQDFNVVEPNILKSLLNAKESEARAAATKMLRYWRDRIPGSLELMRARVNDESARVRIEAVVALSYFNSEQAVTAATDIFKYSTDYYMDYAVHETFRFLKPIWLAGMKQGKSFNGNSKQANRYLLKLADTNELTSLPQTPDVLMAMLTRVDIDPVKKKLAVMQLANEQKIGNVNVLLKAIREEEKDRKDDKLNPSQQELIKLLLALEPAELKKNQVELINLINSDTSIVIQATGFAGVITAEQSDKSLQKDIQEKTSSYLRGISMLTNTDLKASFYSKIKVLAPKVPAIAYPLLMQITLESALKTQSTKEFVASLSSSTSESVQNSQGFVTAISAMKNMTTSLPETDRKEVLAMLGNIGTVEIKLVAIEAKMAFDKKTLTVPSGRAVTLIFENPDVMPHNVVIVKPGTAQKVGEAADAMASLKDGFERNFVPSTPDVLFATPLVNSGKSFRLNFKAPSQPGEYPFICSFPGHWRIMQGILIVTDSKVH